MHKTVICLFSIFWFFTGCVQIPGTQTTTNQIATDTIPSKVTISSPTPTYQSLAVPTLPSKISLIKLKEWNSPGRFAWFSDSSRFAVLSPKSLTIYNTESLNIIWELPLPENKIYSGISISPDDTRIALYSIDAGFKILDSTSGNILHQKAPEGKCFVDILANGMLFIDSRYVLVGFSGDKTTDNRPISVVGWDTIPLTCLGSKIEQQIDENAPAGLKSMELDGNISSLALISTHTNKEMYSGLVTVWGLNTYQEKCSISGVSAKFRPRDNLLAVVDSQNANLTYWDIDNCKAIQQLNLPQYEYSQEIAFSPDSKYLIARRDGFQIYDLTTASLVFEYPLPHLDVNFGGSIGVSSNGKYLLAAYNGRDANAVTLWKINNRDQN